MRDIGIHAIGGPVKRQGIFAVTADNSVRTTARRDHIVARRSGNRVITCCAVNDIGVFVGRTCGPAIFIGRTAGNRNIGNLRGSHQRNIGKIGLADTLQNQNITGRKGDNGITRTIIDSK